MFQPYRYEKASLAPQPLSSDFGWRQILSVSFPSIRLPAGFWQAVPVSLIMLGSGLISTQIAIPFLAVSLETKSLVEPISAGGLNVSPPGDVLGGNVSLPMGEFEELSRIEISLPEVEISEEPPPEFFYLTIPSLGIKEAKIETNSTSMKPDTALGHYRGTALPGSIGQNRNNTFIYGHSALPQYFSPTNYKTIFSTLPKLEMGEEFSLTYKGEAFRFRIEAKQVLKPEDVNPLNPVPWLAPSSSYATLMTCVPPGGLLNRLLIVGKLVGE